MSRMRRLAEFAGQLKGIAMKARVRFACAILGAGALLPLGGCIAGPLAELFFAVGPFLL